MQPFQQRVIDEKTELDSKREKLSQFFGTAQWISLVNEEKSRMQRQYNAMTEYSDVLGERIAAFKE